MITKHEMLAAIQSAEDGPTAAELAAAPTLDEWRIELWNDHFRIYGECPDHPEIDDQFVTTSPIIGFSASEHWARSRSRWYRLGPNFCSPELPERTDQLLREVERALAAQRKQVRAGLQKKTKVLLSNRDYWGGST